MDSTPNPTIPPHTDSASLPIADHPLSPSQTADQVKDGAEPGASAAPSPRIETEYQNKLVQVRLGLAAALFAALRAKHAPTAAHCLRVALGSSSWGLNLDLADQQRDELEVAALLHDIGKIGVPDRILLKPARLDREEAASIDRHRQIGQQILLNCSASQNVLSIVKYASAWWDGSRTGFDRRGQDIPQGARVVSIVDAYDAYEESLNHWKKNMLD